ncbi:hypothetical protein SAMN02799630_03648 [Paenibacillus sp. UNCCL117]|uniref:Ig-like domain-containing protein n=1 Tax=unclassified Paenibacillus TaxID=185978 RepID=UPI00087E3DDF|nr:MULTISPECIES: Ig-like domain-containing protein [unclassified Paenibacillus]SDD52010.1 hypothetical protein SAMN04488602_109149 [Paenibacillus sp. cl123]SFW49375.1 hypothetical protein SAMN02799630_03648 [Paenibacillus sp. UNCCL117]
MNAGRWMETERWMSWTGWSLVAVGSLFVPLMPWYMLGEITEAEIGWWGLCSVAGGIATLGGRLLYLRSVEAVQRGLLLLAIVGMLFVILAQVPALFSWLLYGGAFTKGWMPLEPLGFGIGAVLHLALIVLAALTLVSALYALAGRRRSESGLRLPAKQLAVFAAALLVAGSALWGWDRYESGNWIARTYPADGASEVSVDAQVEVVWHGVRDNMGLKARYADQPDQAIPGTTGGSMSGMTFKPEGGFAPGRRVQITVDADRRIYSFTFTTGNP